MRIPSGSMQYFLQSGNAEIRCSNRTLLNIIDFLCNGSGSITRSIGFQNIGDDSHCWWCGYDGSQN